MKNSQLAETIKVWYSYRDKVKINLGLDKFFFFKIPFGIIRMSALKLSVTFIIMIGMLVMAFPH